MSHLDPKRKLDEVLADAVDLRLQPDFAEWCSKHPEALDALRSLPVATTRKRIRMNRIVRYSMSAAAAIVLLVAGVWWMFFSHGVETSWAQVIEQLAQVRSATCQLNVHGGYGGASKVYIEGNRVRIEDSRKIIISDFHEGKTLEAVRATKKATIHNLQKDSDGGVVLGSNLLDDLVKLKDAETKRLPDEAIGDTQCDVYRVDNPVFLGWKVPWVKLWIDPGSNLPAQIHMVLFDGRIAMTFDNFRWNAPFDKGLLKLAAPQGYELVEEQKADNTQEAVPMEAAITALDTTDTVVAAPGREILGDEIPEVLDILSDRIEANYKAITAWSGTYELEEECRPLQQVCQLVVDFSVEPSQDRIRTDCRQISPPRPLAESESLQQRDEPSRSVTSSVPKPEGWRWVRTPEHSLEFPVAERWDHVEGFPREADSESPKQHFRILHRKGPGAAEHLGAFGTFIDPRFFINGNGMPYWKLCSRYASALRGERGDDDSNNVKKNVVLREYRKGTTTEFVLFTRTRNGYGSREIVFSSEAGFNVVSMRLFTQRCLERSERTCFRQENGVLVPTRIEFKHYQRPDGKNATGALAMHRIFTLKETKVNEPIDPAVFEIQSLGLEKGDCMADRIENCVKVFDGRQFVPAE